MGTLSIGLCIYTKILSIVLLTIWICYLVYSFYYSFKIFTKFRCWCSIMSKHPDHPLLEGKKWDTL